MRKVPKELEQSAADLGDAKAGWVSRRDGAEHLGATAEYALRALLARRKEPDVDVRAAVDKALGRVSAALAGIPPSSGYSLQELAEACAKPGERTVEADGDGYVVTVTVKDGRSQRVTIGPAERGRGPLVCVSTECGAATPDALSWALRANSDLVLSALALIPEDGAKRLVLRAHYLAREVTPPEVKAAVKEIAFYGDWIEQKLMGADDRL